jgi:SAM-dependent methyltransferase
MSLCNDLAIADFLAEQLPTVADLDRGILLDLGCGIQPYRAVYADLFKTVIAADFYHRSKINVRLNISALPFPDESCSVVLLTEVIEHVEDTAQALREISRILKKDGHCFLTWPLLYPLHELPFDFGRYTEFGMQRLLEKVGLRIESLYRRGDLLSVQVAIMEHLSLGLLDLLSRVPWIGSILGLVKPLLRGVFVGAWKSYLSLIGGARRFRPVRVGDSLYGPVNHLSLWTMGYCARIRKQEGL